MNISRERHLSEPLPFAVLTCGTSLRLDQASNQFCTSVGPFLLDEVFGTDRYLKNSLVLQRKVTTTYTV